MLPIYMNRSGRYSLCKRAVRAYAEHYGIELCHTPTSLFRVFNHLPTDETEVHKRIYEDDEDFIVFTEEVCHHGDRLCRPLNGEHFTAISDLTFRCRDLRKNDPWWNKIMFSRRLTHDWKDESPRKFVVWSIFT